MWLGTACLSSDMYIVRSAAQYFLLMAVIVDHTTDCFENEITSADREYVYVCQFTNCHLSYSFQGEDSGRCEYMYGGCF